MVSELDSGTSGRVPVRVRALAGDIVLCSWARHFTLTAPLSIQVYKWVPTNLMRSLASLSSFSRLRKCFFLTGPFLANTIRYNFSESMS